MYEFEEMGIRKTTAEPVYPSEATQIDGTYLEDAVPGYRTLQVQGRELSPQEIKSITVGDADGGLLQGTRNPSRKITVMYQLICDSNEDFRDKFHALNSILHGKSHQVVFRDEPDKYWNATMSDVDTVPGGRNSVTSTFTLYIPDGLSHALTPTTATNENSDGTFADTIELTNHGTVPTPIHVTAEMRSDNGFLGLTLDDRFYQLGNIDEVDAVQLPPSEMIVPNGLAAFGSGKINDTAHQPLPPLMGALSQTGTIVKGTNGINVTDYGTSAAKSWAGPSITWTFPAASDGKIGAKNFFLWQNNEFETDKKPEAGFQVHTVADKSGKRLFTAILLDQSGITNQSKIICFVNDNKVYEADNQWTGKGYRGYMSMTKSGNNFVIVYGNTTKTFVDTELTDSEGYYYTIGFGKWYNNPAPAHNYVMGWNLRQDKIDAWKDVPNFLKAGDIVDLDSKTNTLTINDYPDWDRVDIASEPLLLPPGRSTLGIVCSTFAKPPKVTVDFEERWL